MLQHPQHILQSSCVDDIVFCRPSPSCCANSNLHEMKLVCIMGIGADSQFYSSFHSSPYMGVFQVHSFGVCIYLHYCVRFPCSLKNFLQINFIAFPFCQKPASWMGNNINMPVFHCLEHPCCYLFLWIFEA